LLDQVLQLGSDYSRDASQRRSGSDLASARATR
jgi:hypothetical protein